MTACLWFGLRGAAGVRVTVAPLVTTEARGTLRPVVTSFSLMVELVAVDGSTAHLKTSCGVTPSATPVAPFAGLEDMSAVSVLNVEENDTPGIDEQADCTPLSPPTTTILYFESGS